MMKTEKELNALKKETELSNDKLSGLSEEELKKVAGSGEISPKETRAWFGVTGGNEENSTIIINN